MDERSAAIGLLALAFLAFLLPKLTHRAETLFRPPASRIYAETRSDGATQLVWTPAARDPGVPPGEELAQPVGGAAGLLLGNPLDLNQATLDDLQALPGIGPKTAAAVLELRQEVGGFAAPDDLLRVRGIGPKTLATLRPWVRVGPAPGTVNPPSAGRSP